MTEQVRELGVPEDAFIITPSDSADLPSPGYVRALRMDIDGVVKVQTYAGNDVVLKFLAGETRYIKVQRVYTTGTTPAATIEGMV
jgi:hypothetical protein